MAATADRTYLRGAPSPRLPAPATHAGALGWLRANLFSSPGNIALTSICIVFIAWAVPPLLRFFVIDAVWSGADRDACLASPANPAPGACWAFIRAWSSYFVYGFYPAGERWRVDAFFLALGFGIAWLAWLSRAAPRHRRRLFLRCAADPVLCAVKRGAASRAAGRLDLAVGRHPRHHRGGDGGHRRVLAARHRAGAGAALRRLPW